MHFFLEVHCTRNNFNALSMFMDHFCTSKKDPLRIDVVHRHREQYHASPSVPVFLGVSRISPKHLLHVISLTNSRFSRMNAMHDSISRATVEKKVATPGSPSISAMFGSNVCSILCVCRSGELKKECCS